MASRKGKEGEGGGHLPIYRARGVKKKKKKKTKVKKKMQYSCAGANACLERKKSPRHELHSYSHSSMIHVTWVTVATIFHSAISDFLPGAVLRFSLNHRQTTTSSRTMATVDKRILIRMGKELTDLEQTPPLGVACYPVNDNIVHLQAGRETTDITRLDFKETSCKTSSKHNAPLDSNLF